VTFSKSQVSRLVCLLPPQGVGWQSVRLIGPLIGTGQVKSDP